MKKECILRKNLIIKIKNQKVVMTETFIVHRETAHGLFVLDLTSQCSIPDLDILPVIYTECESDEIEYRVTKDNIVIGRLEDTCLI
jgi:hypothetical protein